MIEIKADKPFLNKKYQLSYVHIHPNKRTAENTGLDQTQDRTKEIEIVDNRYEENKTYFTRYRI